MTLRVPIEPISLKKNQLIKFFENRDESFTINMETFIHRFRSMTMKFSEKEFLSRNIY